MSDRLRERTTMLPGVAEISEALWEEGQSHGVRMGVDEQVAVARTLAASMRLPSAPAVAAAFTKFGMKAPSVAFTTAVAARLRRLYS